MRIVLLAVLLANRVKRLGPRLEGHLIHGEVPRTAADNRSAAAPESLSIRARSQDHPPILIPGSRPRRRGRLAFHFAFAGCAGTGSVLRRRRGGYKEACR